MPKFKLAQVKDKTAAEADMIEVDWPIVPGLGEIVALDEPGTTGNPSGDFLVVSVKHYHYWTAAGDDEVVVFIEDATTPSAKARRIIGPGTTIHRGP